MGEGFSHLLKEGSGVGCAEACRAVILEGGGDAVLCDGYLGGRG